MSGAAQAGLIGVGPVVVISGDWLKPALQAVLIAARTRKLNGLPPSTSYTALAQTLNDALAANGHVDVPETAAVQRFPAEQPTVPVDEAAARLGLSLRQTRRIAPRLGGRRIAGRWWLDGTAITEHVGGQSN